VQNIASGAGTKYSIYLLKEILQFRRAEAMIFFPVFVAGCEERDICISKDFDISKDINRYNDLQLLRM